jgi:hypothetical protein
LEGYELQALEAAYRNKFVLLFLRFSMSLWLQSLDSCLYDYGKDSKERARCILAHLSMTVPRSWWEDALDTGDIPAAYINILQGLRKELIETLELPERMELGLLIALAFADVRGENRKPKYGTFNSRCSIEEYLDRAKKVLTERTDLVELVEKINEKAKLPASSGSRGRLP